MTYEPVKPTGWSKSAIQDFAADVARALGYQAGDPLEELIAGLGGAIQYQGIREVEKSNDGSILIEEDGSFRIFLPDYMTAERNRFTMAHELGHYVLHREPGLRQQAARLTKRENQPAEWEANWFAAGFLMPKDAFLERFDAFEGDIIRVARHFGVSVLAAEIQARTYGKAP